MSKNERTALLGVATLLGGIATEYVAFFWPDLWPGRFHTNPVGVNPLMLLGCCLAYYGLGVLTGWEPDRDARLTKSNG